MLRNYTFFMLAFCALLASNALYAQPANDDCANAIDITSAFVLGPTDTMTVGPYTNVAATSGGVADASCWFDNSDDASVWFTFTAAAGVYDIVTELNCAGIDGGDLNGDTQFQLYAGSCGTLVQVACNDDISGNNFLAGLFGLELEAATTYYLVVDSWSNDMGQFDPGEFCLRVNLGEVINCDDGTAGTYQINSPTDVCFNDTLILTMTSPAVIPPLGGAGLDFFHWVITSEDVSDTTNSIYPDPIFLGQFGQQAGSYNIVYINNPANGLLPGQSYWFTPVVAANAINTDGTFAGLDFSEGCFIAGQSVEINLLDSIGPLDLDLDITLDPDTTMGGAIATANVSGGSGDYIYAWSTGETTPFIDSLTDGTYTLTVFDLTGCVEEVTLSFEIENNPLLPYPDACSDAAQIDTLFGAGMGVSMTSTIYNNLTATTDTFDNADGAGCFFEIGDGEPPFNATIWFTFTGDGLPYNITTVQCDATDYLDFGDSQLILYSGDDCGNLTPLACGEDIDAVNDIYEAEINYQTEVGVTYYLLMDGYDDVTGEFCLQVTQMDFIGCDEIDSGTPELLSSPDVCPSDSIYIVLSDSAVVPELPGFNVFLYLITISDITNSTNLAAVDAAIVGNSPQETSSYDFIVAADIFGGNFGTFYVTPIVIGGALGGPTLSSLDLTNGCIEIGTSIELNLLPETELTADGSSTPANEINGSSDGTATVTVMGGSGDYAYDWGIDVDSATITGLAAGDYTVTVTDNDPTVCAEPLVVTVTVGFVSSTNDPQLNAAVQLFPNPAKNTVNLRYDLGASQQLTIRLVNSLGQTLVTQRLTNVNAGTTSLDISNLSAGMYQLHLTDGQRQTVKSLMIQ